jgi:hypothetical protein
LDESQLSSKKQKHWLQKQSNSQLRYLDSKKREDLEEEEEGADENLVNGARGTRNNEAASPSYLRTASSSSVPRISESGSQSPILAPLETGICKFKSHSKQKFLSPNTASVATSLSLLSRIPYH